MMVLPLHSLYNAGSMGGLLERTTLGGFGGADADGVLLHFEPSYNPMFTRLLGTTTGSEAAGGSEIFSSYLVVSDLEIFPSCSVVLCLQARPSAILFFTMRIGISGNRSRENSVSNMTSSMA